MLSAINPLPDGYHTVTPYLTVRGANEAIEFYKFVFGAEEIARVALPDGRVMHAEIRIGDSILMLSDELPGMTRGTITHGGSKVGMHVYVRDADEAFERAVKAGAHITMPLSNMFWGDRYGRLKDPFGREWAVSTHVEKVAPAEMVRRVQSSLSSSDSQSSKSLA